MVMFLDFNIQGGDHVTYFDILYLYSDRTDKKIVQYSLILNEFSCGMEQIPCLRKKQTNIEVFYVMRCSFLHNL